MDIRCVSVCPGVSKLHLDAGHLVSCVMSLVFANPNLESIKVRFECKDDEADWTSLFLHPDFTNAWPKARHVHFHGLGVNAPSSPSLEASLATFLERHTLLHSLHIELYTLQERGIGPQYQTAAFQDLPSNSLPYLTRLALSPAAMLSALSFFAPSPQLLHIKILGGNLGQAVMQLIAPQLALQTNLTYLALCSQPGPLLAAGLQSVASRLSCLRALQIEGFAAGNDAADVSRLVSPSGLLPHEAFDFATGCIRAVALQLSRPCARHFAASATYWCKYWRAQHGCRTKFAGFTQSDVSWANSGNHSG
jgi:hypothetical protein